MFHYRQVLVRSGEGDSDRQIARSKTMGRRKLAQVRVPPPVCRVRARSELGHLACHRRAFEWFGGVPGRIIIDNAKCAITKAWIYDPEVQRAYAECAEGHGSGRI
jgi:transposase